MSDIERWKKMALDARKDVSAASKTVGAVAGVSADHSMLAIAKLLSVVVEVGLAVMEEANV